MRNTATAKASPRGADAPTEVWIIVLFGVVSGISISVALKHVDNLVVVFAHALSVVFVALASVELFDQQMSSSFASGGVLILAPSAEFRRSEPITRPGASEDRAAVLVRST